MSVDNIKAFFKRLEEDEKFREDFKNSVDIDRENPSSLAVAAEKAGYSFTMDEWMQLRQETIDSELSESELEKVSGGHGVGICLIIGYGNFNTTTVDYDFNEKKHHNNVSIGFCIGYGVN